MSSARSIVAFAFALLVFRGGPMAAADDVEPVLLPITVNKVPGSFGTIWTTELWARNNGPTSVPVFPLAVSHGTLVPNQTVRLRIFEASAASPGQLLFVPHSSRGTLQFDLRLKNAADPDAWGVRLPVVRRDRFATTQRVINVPASSAYRTALRVYAIVDEPAVPVSVRVRLLGSNEQLLADRALPLHGFELLYGQILSLTDEFPSVNGSERITVQLEADTPIWAFVSVVSNSSQQVTILTVE